MHRPVLVTPPSAGDPLISLAEAKAQCRVDSSDEDALITSLVAAATSYLDGYAGILGRALVTQTWRQDFDRYARCLRLPLLAASVTAIHWIDDDGGDTTIAGADYALLADGRGSYVRFVDGFSTPGSLAETAGLKVTFTAGYGAAAAVPPAIKQAAQLLVGHWYVNREAVNVGNITTILPLAADALLQPFRRNLI